MKRYWQRKESIRKRLSRLAWKILRHSGVMLCQMPDGTAEYYFKHDGIEHLYRTARDCERAIRKASYVKG